MTDPKHTHSEAADDDQVQVRIHGTANAPVLVYLPGLHGDWTLVAGFRRAVSKTLRFVEITYPRTQKWSLQDYAAAIATALRSRQVTSGWVLGESFGSQILWELLNRQEFRVEGVVLAGGFGRHPTARIAGRLAAVSSNVSYGFIKATFAIYALASRIRFRRSPETIASIRDFVSRRTMADWQAMRHRLELVAGNDPAAISRAVKIRVYAITGFWDPIVPWYGAKRWLKANCAELSGYRVILNADHNVLGTAPAAAAAQVLQWMTMQPEPCPMPLSVKVTKRSTSPGS